MARDISRYERALQEGREAESKSRTGGGGNFFDSKKPSKKGEQIRQRLRIIPRLIDGVVDDEFWVISAQHGLTIDGQYRSFGCPDGINTPESECRCPMCLLSRELYETRNKEYGVIARELSARVRGLQNIIDLEEPELGVQIWGCSRALHLSIMDICVVKRAFIEDPEVGRDVFLTTRRIGSQKMDIRY